MLPKQSKRRADMRGGKGFTIVETVVVVAITSILLGFLLPAFLSFGRIYRATVDANMLYIKSVNTMSFLKESVQNSTDLRIINGETQPADGYFSIWCDGGKIYYQNGKNTRAVYMQDTRFSLSFTGEGNRLGILLEVLTEGEPYKLESAVALSSSSKISGISGIGILFKTATDTR